MRYKLCAAIFVGFFCLALASCLGSSPPDGYLATGTNSTYFIQFTTQNSQISGHIQGITETNDVPPQTKSSSTAFTGTQNGSAITIIVSVFGFSSSVVGTQNGDLLTLEVPQTDGHLQSETFIGASLQQYNQAVDALQKKVAGLDQQYNNDQATVTTQNDNAQATATAAQATQTIEQQQQRAVSNANSAMSDELNTLKSDAATLSSFSNTSTIASYANDWQTMQKDYAAEQKDAQAGCNNGNYSQVSADDNQVSADSNQISADDNQLSADKNQYDTDVSPVQTDIQAIKDDWTQLQQAAANNTTKTPAPAYTLDDEKKALQSAQDVENIAKNTWQSAQSRATQYDQEASELQKQADAIPVNMYCS